MGSAKANEWRNNRATSLKLKIIRWKSNPVGGVVRILEFLYFGQPLINFFIGNNGKRGNSFGIELIAHMSNSIDSKNTDENLIFLESVRIDLRENFMQLDTGHILNTRKTTNEILSGEYWSQIRKILKSRISRIEREQVVYPIANQKFFFHFLIEELPEIISANNSGLVGKFVSLRNQPKYVTELLTLAGIEIEVVDDEIGLYGKVICPTYSRACTAWSVEQLQTLIGKKEKNIKCPEKILLLRNGKVRSDIKFEERLKEYLIPKGFTYLNLDNYDNSQQISFFENASAIVAIHGAALSNIVFTRKDCQIFEIFNHPYRTYFFRELARIKSNRYFSAESSVALGEIEIWLESIK